MKVLHTCHIWFPKGTPCSPGSLLAFPHPCSYIAGSAAKGRSAAGPHLLQVQLPSLVPTPLTTPGMPPQPRAGELPGFCFHPAAPPLPPGATDKCSNRLRECSFSNPASLYRTYFKHKGNYPENSHKKASFTLKDTCIYFTCVPDRQSYHL